MRWQGRGGLAAWTLATGMALVGMPAQAQRLGLLEAVQLDGQLVYKLPPGGGKPAPVLREVTGGALYQRLQRESNEGLLRTLLAMDAAAQRTAGVQNIQPTWLLNAEEDGGFARRGFWLRGKGGEQWQAEPYVDLPVDEASVEDGGFEEIFAHELGHVFLRRLLPHLPEGYSRTPHGSPVVTDEATAFDEGFATHMQGLVRRYTHNARLRAFDQGLRWKPLTSLWQSNTDRELRLQGMRQNLFVHAQLPITGTDALRLRRDLSSMFDRSRLKNGNQMLASEGFIATVFYQAQLTGAEGESTLPARYQPLFDALRQLNGQPLKPSTHLLPALVQATPDAALRKSLAHWLVNLSYGATVRPTLSQQVAQLAERGQLGDMEAFVAGLKPLRSELAKLADQAADDPARLTAGLAESIWLLNAASPIEAGKDKLPLTLDLNTAEAEHLRTLPGVGPATAAKLVASREQYGPFRSLVDFCERGELPPGTATLLEQMREAALAAGPYSRE
ncbi:ComEA family DNA-binding protein [Chitinimonas sp.]|uniref:ComEA family DNA-binding protein n=1 Tax=Chitinimonas sp. TaxID=1934313 RepID=UPI002F91FACC